MRFEPRAVGKNLWPDHGSKRFARLDEGVFWDKFGHTLSGGRSPGTIIFTQKKIIFTPPVGATVTPEVKGKGVELAGI